MRINQDMMFNTMDKRMFTKSLKTLMLSACFLSSPAAIAGFLEMPDTSEVPSMKRNSMLKDLDIPEMRYRDPDPNAGPRLNVTQFRVQGIVEYPELGITRDSLNTLVESIRFDMMAEDKMLESGYTIDEVSQVSDLIADIEEETVDEAVTKSDVQRLVFLIREQRQRRGVTVGMVEEVADAITRYYRERGFILAKAYIPKQRVRDGIVTLTLLLGDLGEVTLLNNKKYKDATIQKLFASSLGKPVTAKNIEERLFFVNDLPGFSAQAYFEPGSQVGDTKLNISALNERSFAGNVRLDTHGSESTGENRLYADGYWFSPSGIGDQLHIGLLGTFNPENSTYGSLHYGLPFFSPRAKLTVGGSSNDFVSTSISGVELSGQSVVLDSTLNYILKRSRIKNYSVEARVSQVSSDILTGAQAPPSTPAPPSEGAPPAATSTDNEKTDTNLGDTVRNVDLVFNFDVLLEKLRAMHQGGVRLTYGNFIEGQNDYQSDTPVLLALNYTLTKFMKVPFTADSQSRLQFKFSGQYSEGALPSISQFALSGPSRLRGFSVNHFNADSAAYAGLDWVFNGPSFLNFKIGGDELSRMLQPYLFIEGAYGDSKLAGLDGYGTPENKSRNIWAMMSDVGAGLRFSYKNTFRANVSLAHTTSHRKGTQYFESTKADGILHTDRNKIYFDMQYSF